MAVFLAACAATAGPSGDGREVCTGYPAWQSSAYLLPYEVGSSHRVLQGNCSPPGSGHRGNQRYGYDFDLSIGTPVAASRAGVVVALEKSNLDGQNASSGQDNFVLIAHSDGTTGLYGHLTHDGVVVALGQNVAQGALVGYSGNTGNTGGLAHLHFSVHHCNVAVEGDEACPSIPVTFRNTDPNPNGLEVGRAYRALASGN
jgi:murein DD-endopeptidase MepM/ murein hydrolase activator NlpD